MHIASSKAGGVAPEIRLDGKIVSPDDVRQRLTERHRAHPDIIVEITADGDLPYVSVQAALDPVMRAGVERTAFRLPDGRYHENYAQVVTESPKPEDIPELIKLRLATEGGRIVARVEDEKPVDVGEGLAPLLARRRKALGDKNVYLLIQPDRETPYSALMTAYDSALKAGFDQIPFAVVE